MTEREQPEEELARTMWKAAYPDGMWTSHERQAFARAARAALDLLTPALIEAVRERCLALVVAERDKLGGRWSLDSAYLAQAIVAIRALDLSDLAGEQGKKCGSSPTHRLAGIPGSAYYEKEGDAHDARRENDDPRGAAVTAAEQSAARVPDDEVARLCHDETKRDPVDGRGSIIPNLARDLRDARHALRTPAVRNEQPSKEVDGVVCAARYDPANDILEVTVSFKANGRRVRMLSPARLVTDLDPLAEASASSPSEHGAGEREMLLGMMEGQTFGSWLVARVQASTGREPIFTGDENRQRHIRKEFDERAGELVRWAAASATPTTEEKE